MTAVLKDIPAEEFREKMAVEGVRFHVGPYVYELRSSLPSILTGLQQLYGDYRLAPAQGFADFHVAMDASGIVQRLRRTVDFSFDFTQPLETIERRHAYAFLEWGMNWCVSVCTNEYLKLHAAVVAKDGVALVMPGLPGAGKSTLCAALALRGWRVLSDEHALIDVESAMAVPVCRPVSLKNASLDVIKAFDSRAIIGPQTDDTHKGVVAHMKADMHPDSHDIAPVPVRLMIFPEYVSGLELQMTERTKAESFIFAAHHSFNYSLLGEVGFHAMSSYMDTLDCFSLKYSNLDEAISAISALHTRLSGS